jgi:hypothetical protein
MTHLTPVIVINGCGLSVVPMTLGEITKKAALPEFGFSARRLTAWWARQDLDPEPNGYEPSIF